MMEQALLVSDWLAAVVVTVTAALAIKVIHWLWCVPYNRVRLQDEVGYGHLMGGKQGRKVKASQIRMAKRSRKVGDIPPPYPNGWYVLIQSFELQPGDVKEVHALGEHFAVFRSTDGEKSVHVTDLYCPHLGASFSSGTVRGKCIRCPFHSREFDGTTGNCVRIPNYNKLQKSPGQRGVKVWPSMEANGLIYAWYHAEGYPPNWFPRQLPQLSKEGPAEWVYQGRTEFHIACHVEDIPENGGDFAHFTAIHKTSVLGGGEPSRTMSDFLDLWSSHEWEGRWKALGQDSELDEDFIRGDANEANKEDSPSLTQDHVARLDLVHSFKLFGKKLKSLDAKVLCYQVGPATVEIGLDLPGIGYQGVMLQNVLPLEPMLQKLVYVFYTNRKWLAPMAKLFLWSEAVLLERDITIWGSKTYLQRPWYATPEDRLLRQHRKWYAQFYSEHSKTFAKSSNEDSLDW